MTFAAHRYNASYEFLNDVDLVADHQLTDRPIDVLLNFRYPLWYVLQSLRPCEIKDEDNAVRTSIVAAGDGAKSFLAGSIPNLQFHAKSIQFKCFYPEVKTNGDHVLIGEAVFGKTQQQTGLAHFTVANEKQFEDVVTV
ncbi:hypothetical protein TYRP_013642 [Tyrophagus putrescentiae]|nr:hypothetical protein TYRP_013642 [Tyrophagus putrescentiae]